MKEWYAAVKGQRFGPISEDVLKEWVASGRVGADDHVWCEGMTQWSPSRDVPELAESVSAAAPAGGAGVNPYAAQAGAGLAAPGAAYAPPVRASMPHRGGVILALGIVSIVMGCFVDLICGFIALNMAKKDLPLMASGQMDPTGRGMTDAGRICGIVGIVLGFIRLGVMIIYAIVLIGLASSGQLR